MQLRKRNWGREIETERKGRGEGQKGHWKGHHKVECEKLAGNTVRAMRERWNVNIVLCAIRKRFKTRNQLTKALKQLRAGIALRIVNVSKENGPTSAQKKHTACRISRVQIYNKNGKPSIKFSLNPFYTIRENKHFSNPSIQAKGNARRNLHYPRAR